MSIDALLKCIILKAQTYTIVTGHQQRELLLELGRFVQLAHNFLKREIPFRQIFVAIVRAGIAIIETEDTRW